MLFWSWKKKQRNMGITSSGYVVVVTVGAGMESIILAEKVELLCFSSRQPLQLINQLTKQEAT